MSFPRPLAIVCALFALIPAALSHELWLEPKQFELDQGQSIEADIRVGQAFKGSPLSFNPNGFERFHIATDETVKPVTGRLGDVPAANVDTLTDGLNVLIYHASNALLTYTEWVKFTAFVDHKDFQGVYEQHKARGSPQTQFKEVYSRYAKSLVAVGKGEGRDKAFGLETEIVALANPYTDDLAAGLPVQVLYQNSPRAGAQVEVFERPPNGEVLITILRTNSEGVAHIPVQPGHTYMIDAVVLREPNAALAEETGAVWESLWANLTFKMPD